MSEDEERPAKLVRYALTLLLPILCLTAAGSYALGRRTVRNQTARTVETSATPTRMPPETSTVLPSDPAGVTGQEDFASATASWKSYRNDDLQFTLRYPAAWRLTLEQADPSLASAGRTDASHAYIELMPERDWADWLSRPDSSDKASEVGPVSVECQRSNKTLAQTVQAYGQGSYAAVAGDATLRSGQPSYYVLGKAVPIQTFLVANGSVECELSKATTDASPYSKAEDSEGMGIVNTFVLN